MGLISVSDTIEKTINQTKIIMINEGYNEKHTAFKPSNNEALLRILDELNNKFKNQLSEVSEKKLKELK